MARDNRPIYRIGCGGPTPTETNPQGLRPELIENGFLGAYTWLYETMLGVDNDRIMLHQPRGWSWYPYQKEGGAFFEVPTYMPATQWEPIPDFLKEAYAAAIRDVRLAKPDLQISIHASIILNQAYPGAAFPLLPRDLHYPSSPADAEDREVLYKRTIYPWKKAAGTGFLWWADMGSRFEHWPQVKAWDKYLGRRGIKLGMEALPTIAVNNVNMAAIDNERLKHMPAYCTDHFIRTYDKNKDWRAPISDGFHECHIQVKDATQDEQDDWISRGFIMMTM